MLWLAGLGLRITLLAVPPVLPLIHRDLGLSESAVAVLVNLPVLMLAGSSIFGSLLVARLGARSALIAGLALIAVSSAFRGIGHSVAILYALTFLMGFGIAVIQPAFPALTRSWFPERVPLATSVWANGLLVGEALSASLTLPLVLPLAHGNWSVSFAIWGAFLALVTIVVAAFTSRGVVRGGAVQARWLPNFRDPKQWQLGLLQASASIAYFGANALLPDFLHATGRTAIVGPCLSALNVGQLPASLAVGLLPIRVIARAETAFALGAAMFVSIGGILAGGAWAVAGAGLVGFCGAFILVLSFAVPALSAAPADVARLSAGTYTIGYTSAFLTSLAGGALWDATHAPYMAFLPIATGGAIVAALGPRIVRIMRHHD